MHKKPKKITYKDSGVNYDLMDKFKRDCQRASEETVRVLYPEIAEEILKEMGVGESASIVPPQVLFGRRKI